ncbi:phytanoyl-CoA dioxygenase family protein [Sorangium sp. So ce321]|uniref:phytanoyl-CoA dioxygenase family protein n=1 Tax=Sorangium sp. So ce321 TaxID=3133300 RepID=UPI003F61AD6D
MFAARPPGLTASERARFDRDGFLAVEGFVLPAQCDALRARAAELVDGFDPAEISIFSTRDQARSTDAYFLGSGDQIRFFFEEEAFLPDGSLRQAKAWSINKIGHALHDLDPAFARFSRSRALASVVSDLGPSRPLLLQSMYIFKNPFIGGDVGCHQDATFLYTDPLSVIGLWFALEDATVDNGCMWALPGGHRGPLRRRFVRDGDGTRMIALDDTPLPAVAPRAPYVPIEAPRGTMVLLHGLLPHWSGANRSGRSRHAYAIHVVDGACRYPEDNWLRRPPDRPARGFET